MDSIFFLFERENESQKHQQSRQIDKCLDSECGGSLKV